jgi:hypothetical protein
MSVINGCLFLASRRSFDGVSITSINLQHLLIIAVVSLMLHYHLSILMLVDIIEATDRPDLLPDIIDISIDAENTVMNTLAFGLHNNFTLKRPDDESHSGNKAVFTVPIVSIDPYPHHAVAGVQLLRKAIERDFGIGKITEETYQSLLETLERTLRHLPQSSKSVQAAITKFSTVSDEESTPPSILV